MNKEAQSFIYGEGRNPFGSGDGVGGDTVFPGMAGVERDEFEPAHERPYVGPSELRRLGITK